MGCLVGKDRSNKETDSIGRGPGTNGPRPIPGPDDDDEPFPRQTQQRSSLRSNLPKPDPRPSEQISESLIVELQNQGKKIVRANYDFSLTQSGDLSLKKGDVLEVISEDGDWFEARNLITNERGYVPATYVTVEKSLPSYDWYHGDLPRPEAESRLLTMSNERGTFLIRLSKTATGSFTLSMLDQESDDMNAVRRAVRHYRVKNTDAGGCYVATKKLFNTIVDLVAHYKRDADGLCFRLTRPCPKPNPMLVDMSRDMKDKWEIPRHEIKLLSELGKGNFGTVHKALWKGSRYVAVKTLKEGSMSPQKFLEEAAVMKKLRHAKIVCLYAVCSREEPILIVTELMTNGSLHEYLREGKGRYLNPLQLLDISAQVADGMRFIEANNFIHRDLAARNILVGELNSVKIGDFGLAKLLEEEQDQTYTAKEGTKFPIKWTAPEAILYGHFTIKSDIWAYGILVIELFTYGATPYPGMTNAEVVQQLPRGFRHPEPAGCPERLYDEILQMCWVKEPSRRPTFEFLYYTMNDLAVALEPNYKEA